jgi:hypothetical protein
MDSACSGLVGLPLKTCNDSAIRKNTAFDSWLRKRLMGFLSFGKLSLGDRVARTPLSSINDSISCFPRDRSS